MKTKRTLTILFISLFALSVFAAKKSVSFNVMISDSKGKSTVEKRMKSQTGVMSVKANPQMGTVAIEYDDTKTDVNALVGAFKSAGFYASPVGESCANKPGGCLNNKPTTTNTMR